MKITAIKQTLSAITAHGRKAGTNGEACRELPVVPANSKLPVTSDVSEPLSGECRKRENRDRFAARGGI